jgi:hypothetical protein
MLMAVAWKVQPAAGTIVGERERESRCGMGESEIQPGNAGFDPVKR